MAPHYFPECVENEACVCDQYVEGEVTVFYDDKETNAPDRNDNAR